MSSKNNKVINYIKKHFIITVIEMLAVLFLSTIVATSIGQVNIPFSDTFTIIMYRITGLDFFSLENIDSAHINIIWLIRLPRVLTAGLVGIGLTICGIVMQASIQNPLADPYILGISSGATLGATFALLIGIGSLPFIGQLGLATVAFIGALVASILVLVFANIGGKPTSTKLVLSGTVIDSMFSAFSSLIIYLSNNQQGLQNVTFWMMGSVASANWSKLPLLFLVVLISSVYFITQRRTLNIILMGDEGATTLGVNINFYRKLYLIVAALITGIIVSNCGMIGFVGLIIPHIIRALLGSDHKYLLPFGMIFGAIFMILTDLLARTIISGSEIPVGIITASFGAPIFLYMLVRKKYGFGGN